MKLPLWILNSSLLVIFLMVLLLNLILKQEPPQLRIRRVMPEIEKKKAPLVINIERIYKQDIFDTFTPQEKMTAAQNLITPIPQPKQPVFVPPPEPVKPEFIPQLNISLKGIIASSNEQKSVAMIADETNKEKVYHLGEVIKDAQILKIERDKIIILRANGQQEILLLRKKEEIPGIKPEEKWQYIVKKIDDQNYEIDPKEFSKQVNSLANFMETLSLNTAYKKGEAIGLKVGKIETPELGSSLGIKQNDILLSINNINTADVKNRIKIYDEITQLKKGDQINVLLKRNNIDTPINYKFAKIGIPKKKAFIEPATQAEGQPQQPGQQTSFKSSSEQQREKQIREFEKMHKEPQHKDVMSDIRKRLLENMRSRAKDIRVR